MEMRVDCTCEAGPARGLRIGSSVITRYGSIQLTIGRCTVSSTLVFAALGIVQGGRGLIRVRCKARGHHGDAIGYDKVKQGNGLDVSFLLDTPDGCKCRLHEGWAKSVGRTIIRRLLYRTIELDPLRAYVDGLRV